MLLNVKLFCVYVLDVCFLEKKKTTICCPLGTILLFLDKESENIFRAKNKYHVTFKICYKYENRTMVEYRVG